MDLKVHALYVDGRARESTLGPSHEITERLFVVLRAFRVNDTLPGDKAAAPGWLWQRGALPEYDPYYSVASWYRDYAAYCGVSDDGKKLFAIVFQVGRRKPVMKKPLGDDDPDSECPSPVWERRPVRVTFEPDENPKTTYSVRTCGGFSERRRGGGRESFAIKKAGRARLKSGGGGGGTF